MQTVIRTGGGGTTRTTHEAPPSRVGPRNVGSGSESPDVLRLGALGALGDVELNLLVLVEGLVALRLNRRVVHEDVVAAVLLRNEAETLLGVEPLHGALSHVLCTPVIGTRGRHFDVPAPDAVTRRSDLQAGRPEEETPLDHKLRGRRPAGTCTCCTTNPTNKTRRA